MLDDTGPGARSTRDEEPPGPPRTAALVASFAAVAFLMTFRFPSRLRSHVPGDYGDTLLNLWIIRSAQSAALHGWGALWDTAIFHPAPNTLAYSEALLPVALVHWPLRLVLGDVLAFNLIYLAAWTLSLWCTYRLALRLSGRWEAAAVAALMWTFCTVRLVHHVHFQLVMGWLIPLVLLQTLRCLDSPSVRRGAWLGLALAMLTLSASYYGVLLGTAVPLLVASSILLSRPSSWRALLACFGTGALLALAFVGPVAFKYVELQRDPHFRRPSDQAGSAQPADFIAAADGSYVLDHLPVIEPRSRPESRSIENRLFPGFAAIGLGLVGVTVMIRRRGGALDALRRRETALVVLAGVLGLSLAAGDDVALAGHRVMLPFHYFRRFVPGYSGMRATARLVVLPQLALAVLAAVGLAHLLRGRTARWAIAATAVVSVLVLAESAIPLMEAPVPTRRADGAVNALLAERPRGVVLELPILSSADGWPWPYVEAPRQWMGLADGDERVNGYSGFEPPGFDALANRLDRLPSPSALHASDSLGVRYVVLRTRLIGTLFAWQQSALAVEGTGRYSDSAARRVIDGLPRRRVASVDRFDGGYLVELRPAPARARSATDSTKDA